MTILVFGGPMRITVNGQVTIPKAIRDRFGFLPHSQVEFVADEAGVRLIRAGTWGPARPEGDSPPGPGALSGN